MHFLEGDPELLRIVDSWATLPEHAKATIGAIVSAAQGGAK